MLFFFLNRLLWVGLMMKYKHNIYNLFPLQIATVLWRPTSTLKGILWSGVCFVFIGEGGREVNRKVVGSRCPGVSHGAGGVGGDSSDSLVPSLTAQPGPVGTRQGTGQRSGCLGVGGCTAGCSGLLYLFLL